jgi:hypothetical protein
MAIRIAATRTVLQTAYTGNASWIGLATADPGATATPANEITGGSPAYARKQTTWTGGTGSAVTIDSPSATIAWIILATAATVGAANQADNYDCADVTLSGQGTIVVTPTITIT